MPKPFVKPVEVLDRELLEYFNPIQIKRLKARHYQNQDPTRPLTVDFYEAGYKRRLTGFERDRYPLTYAKQFRDTVSYDKEGKIPPWRYATHRGKLDPSKQKVFDFFPQPKDPFDLDREWEIPPFERYRSHHNTNFLPPKVPYQGVDYWKSTLHEDKGIQTDATAPKRESTSPFYRLTDREIFDAARRKYWNTYMFPSRVIDYNSIEYMENLCGSELKDSDAARLYREWEIYGAAPYDCLFPPIPEKPPKRRMFSMTPEKEMEKESNKQNSITTEKEMEKGSRKQSSVICKCRICTRCKGHIRPPCKCQKKH